MIGIVGEVTYRWRRASEAFSQHAGADGDTDVRTLAQHQPGQQPGHRGDDREQHRHGRRAVRWAVSPGRPLPSRQDRRGQTEPEHQYRHR